MLGSFYCTYTKRFWNGLGNGIYDIPANYLNVFITPKINYGVDDYPMRVGGLGTVWKSERLILADINNISLPQVVDIEQRLAFDDAQD